MRPFRWWQWLLWAVVMAGVTVLLLAFRGRLDKAHVTLVYLFVVLAGTLAGGRRLGLALAGIAFLLFNWFFLHPYNTLAIRDPLDWLVLVAFLLVSGVAAEGLHRLQREADMARQRAAEVDRFAALGAEALNVGRAADALTAVSEVIRTTLTLATCRVHVAPDASAAPPLRDEPLVAWTAEHGRTALRQGDGTSRVTDAPGIPEALPADLVGLFLPLQVRGRTVGVLELRSTLPVRLSPDQRRFLAALTYYVALGVERVRLEAEAGHVEALREADRLKDALLASVSHDLRTPLTTIKALARELRGRDERAMVIEEEADRLNRLVADLLDLSRLKAGVLTVSVELYAVDDLVGALLQRVSGALGSRELRVRMEDGGTLLVGRFDLAQSLRILVNLVDNANKYAPPGTPIELTISRNGDRIAFALADQGPGVEPGQASRIFEPFYRPPGAPPDAGSAGLGLAIARQLARAQGGDLTYAPRTTRGSVFVLTLPAAELPEPDSRF